jgi:hypothetical protein
VFWDFAWVWGPPEDHFAHLDRTIGAERFVYGTHWPLRLTQNPRANLELLHDSLRAAAISDAASICSVGKRRLDPEAGPGASPMPAVRSMLSSSGLNSSACGVSDARSNLPAGPEPCESVHKMLRLRNPLTTSR